MKVLIFIETGGPGGAERVVLELSRGLQEAGIEVLVVTLRIGWLTEMLAALNIPHLQLVSERSFDVSLPLRLSRLVRERGVDIIHSHLLDSNFYGSIAARIANRGHLGTEHGDVHHSEPKRFLNLKIKLIKFLGSQLSCVSRFSAEKLNQLGFPSERIDIVPNPVTRIVRSEETRRQLRKAFGIEDESIWLWAHVANLRPVKDQETLIRGFAASKKSTANQALLIVGDGPERSKLELLSRELEAEVLFAGHRDDVSKILQASDGFVMSSVSESMPMALLEAASAGLFLVSSAVGGIPELIDETSGRLFPAGDSVALASVLSSVVSVSDAARASAHTMQDRICRERSLRTVCQAYINIYQRLARQYSGK